jgi:hypothetical protein
MSETPNSQDSYNEKIISLLKEVLYNSLAQAIIKIALTPYTVLKIILFLFALGTCGFASYLIRSSLLTYASYCVSTRSRSIYETPTLFPQVTFCNYNSFATKYAYDLRLQGIHNGNSLSNEAKKLIGHDMDDILIECLFNNKVCDSSNFIWSFNQILGNCFTFNGGLRCGRK